MTEPLSEADTLATLRRLSPSFGTEVGGRWFACTSLLSRPDLVDRLVREHAASRQTSELRFAASLFYQRYCHRLASVVIGVWVLRGAALDAAPRHSRICVRDASPASVALTGVRRPSDTPEEVSAGLVDAHLLPLARVIRDLDYGLSLPNMWGNMAASIGQAARSLSRVRDASLVQSAVAPILATRPLLEKLGRFRVLTGDRGPRLFYDRASCCHWHAVPGGKYCSYCSLLTDAERTARFIKALETE